MRPSEEYVLRTLVEQFGGQYIEGEDPPDGYILNDRSRIAVEVSTLVEQLRGRDGESYSRMKDDAPAKNLAMQVESDIGEHIPDGIHVFLVIGAPVTQIRRTHALVGKAIVEMIRDNIAKLDHEVLGNSISISIFTGWHGYTPKISCAISNRFSSANIGENTTMMLKERIETKDKKRNVQPSTTEYWLALFNDYWVADERSYQLAYSTLDIEHDFDKILIINGNRQAYVLHKT